MSKRSNSGIQTQAVGEDIFDVVGADGFEVLVDCPLCDYDNGFALACFTVLYGTQSVSQNREETRERPRIRILTLLIKLHISSSQDSASGGRSGRRM